MIKSFLGICFLFLYGAINAQTIRGTVYDGQTKKPLLGASVYFEVDKNSTAQMVISYLGYQDIVFPLPDKDVIDVYLKPKAESLSEVVVTANPPFTRKQLLAAFRKQFLGNTKGGRSCKILNEHALYLYYDTAKNQIRVSADEVLRIENPYLGYEIRFRLYECKIDYFKKSISEFDVQQSFYAGTSFFIDKEDDSKKHKKRRKEVYQGSSLHLMRTIITEQWDSEKFTFYKRQFPADPKQYFVLNDTLGIKKVTLLHPLSVLYKKRKQSAIRTNYDSFTIDGFGNSYPPDALVYSGIMGAQRIGDALPLDYGL